MGMSTQVKNFAAAVLRFADATTPTPLTYVLALFQGDVTFGPIGEYLNEDVAFSAITQFAGLGVGPPVYPEVSFTALTYNLVGNDPDEDGSPLEFVHGLGCYDDAVSVLGANRLHCVDVRVTIEGTRWGDPADETIDFETVRFTEQFSMASEGNKLEFTGIVYGSIVFTNSDNVVTITRL